MAVRAQAERHPGAGGDSQTEEPEIDRSAEPSHGGQLGGGVDGHRGDRDGEEPAVLRRLHVRANRVPLTITTSSDSS